MDDEVGKDPMERQRYTTGGEALLRGLVIAGVEHCFMNPGTSEMHLVAALDSVEDIKGILALFEGVATGAADGYGRMKGVPAAAVLHLGPGLANGIANLHNAARAHTPVVNIVGDHATEHLEFDPPLASDIESLARPVSVWYRKAHSAEHLASDAAAAFGAACGPPGGVATLVVPAELTWKRIELSGGDDPGQCSPAADRRAFEPGVAELVADALMGAAAKGEPAAILLGGSGLSSQGITAGCDVADFTGAKLLSETFPARVERGGGIPEVQRLGYLPEHAMSQLSGIKHLVLAGAASPASFFKYPGLPSSLVPPDCQVHRLAGSQDDVAAALEGVLDVVGCSGIGGRDKIDSTLSGTELPLPKGPLNAQSAAAVIGALLPEGAIVSDESNTSGIFLASATSSAPRHDWLSLTGGAIGQGMPVAVGAAVACPDRKVLSLEADGSAMYTIQALWTQAREGLDVVTIIFDNRSYAILNFELSRVGAGVAGERAKEMLSLAGPELDFVSLAQGMGVQASRAQDAEMLADQLAHAISEKGPWLIQAVMG